MHQFTLAEIARGLADKTFSSEELTRSLLARIQQLDPQLNTWVLKGGALGAVTASRQAARLKSATGPVHKTC
jgi:aspartyl-tRNA(Asn)/glutamyl-tRNA(Gln) amidotransferase subunit A